jgi:hypothetical protein
MNLKHLTDTELLKELEKCVQQERHLSIKVLHHLKEVDRRRLYSDQGCKSLYDYVTSKLGYSAGAAYRRVQAARMLAEIPEIEEKIQGGLLTLTHITDAASFFRENQIHRTTEKKEILTQVQGLNKRDTSIKLHEYAKKPFVRMIPVALSEATIQKVETWRGLRPAIHTADQLIGDALDIAITKTERSRHNTGVRKLIYQRDEKKCTICGSTHDLQYDHIQPKALGGGDTVENLRLLCFSCNQRARIRAGL